MYLFNAFPLYQSTKILIGYYDIVISLREVFTGYSFQGRPTHWSSVYVYVYFPYLLCLWFCLYPSVSRYENHSLYINIFSSLSEYSIWTINIYIYEYLNNFVDVPTVIVTNKNDIIELVFSPYSISILVSFTMFTKHGVCNIFLLEGLL